MYFKHFIVFPISFFWQVWNWIPWTSKGDYMVIGCIKWSLAVIRQVVWSCPREAHPNIHICLVVPGHFNSRKDWAKKKLGKAWNFRPGSTVPAVWTGCCNWLECAPEKQSFAIETGASGLVLHRGQSVWVLPPNLLRPLLFALLMECLIVAVWLQPLSLLKGYGWKRFSKSL